MRELSYSQPQTWVAILFAVLTAVVAAVFVVVALRSRRAVPFDDVKRVGYRIRSRWLIALGTVLTLGVAASLLALPYSGARGATGKPQQVRVAGGQFFWSASPASVRTGRVRFSVTAVDVNHGLGLYAPGGRLIGSVQAMPDYTNRLDVQLDEPGEYLFSCLEMCGVGHHRMHLAFKVTPR